MNYASVGSWSTVKVLVTGGAGFIGSNLAARLLDEGYAVRVLDDFSTGRRENVDERAELIEGDIDDEELVREAVRGVQVVFHQAAAGSVARSVAQPLVTDRVNTHGTLTVLKASLDSGVQRVVSASSSSIYGGAAALPSVETATPMPRSPYAVSKLAGEHYCRVFTQVYGLETVTLRYFNVYGPRQRPDSAYAAVIPLFIDALSVGQQPVIHGDGQQSRDFTFVDDVVEANLAAATSARCSSCRRRVQHRLRWVPFLARAARGPWTGNGREHCPGAYRTTPRRYPG